MLLCRVPGHIDFPEVNLRTYVRHGDRRGVVFIRELVPRRLVAAVARGAYNEPYAVAPMESATAIGTDRVCVTHRLRWRGREHVVTAVGSTGVTIPPADSAAHFFKEQEWGYGRSRDGRLLAYRVRHPVWPVREMQDLTLDVDFGALYGEAWASLTGAEPTSTVFAVGSPVVVERPQKVARPPGPRPD